MRQAIIRQRGRLLVAGVVAVYFVVLALLGGQSAWDRLGVNDLQPSFADLRSLTSAWECERDGTPVLPSNPCDPYGGRGANYLEIWLAPSHLGLGQGATVAIGVATGLGFFASFLVLIGNPGLREASLYAFAAISPAVMLGVERASVDLLLFPMIVAAVFVFRRGLVGRVTGWVLLFLGAILKIFPALAWGVLLRQSPRVALVSGAVMVGLFALYIAASHDTVQSISEVTPQSIERQWGADVGVDSLQDAVEGTGGLGWLADFGDWLTALAVSAGACAIAALAWRRRTFGDLVAIRRDPELDLRLDAFVAGAGIYALSFVLWQHNDYRLVFLLLTLPQIIVWTRAARSPVPAPRLTLVALLGTLWLSRPLTVDTGFWNPALDFLTLDDLGFSLDEVLNWVLFVTLGVGLVLATALRPLQDATEWLVGNRASTAAARPAPSRLRA